MKNNVAPVNNQPDSAPYQRYELTHKLGEGGMGIVYRATDRLTGETVALKQVHLSENLQLHDSLAPGATEDDLRLALAHEFQILAGLRHPHIISVLDYGFDGEKRPFFTMTYLPETENILDAAKDHPFERKIELIQQLLQALSYLHRRGVLHRDLKPDNVLVSDGMVRVLDFGLSASDKLGSSSIGTPLYMAPELFKGVAYSQSADLYAVGVILYQLFTGQHPFAPFDYKFLDRVSESVPNLEDVDERIRPFLTQLLAKKAGERFAAAPEALRALAKALNQPAPPETAEIRESYLQAAKFVGREAEMAQLTDLLHQKESAVWLVGGESGVGKTRLLDELRSRALVAGWQVLSGQAVPEGGLPYQLWQDVVPHLALTTPLSDLEASVLHQITPALSRLLDRQIPEPPALEGTAVQQRLVLTLISVLQRQTQPTLLLLEDLHWARESLTPLQQLLKVLDQTPHVLVIATYRSDEQPRLPEKLPGAQLLPLNRLNEAQVAELSQAMLGARASNPEIVSLLTKETEGNTFFIVEVMRALAEEAGRLEEIGSLTLPTQILTEGMQQLLWRRIRQLSPADQQRLRLAAVAGRQLDLALLEYVQGAAKSLGWLHRAAEAAILVPREGHWLFAHEKLRDTLLATMDASSRQTQHRRVAEAIEALYPENGSYFPLLLEHWHQADDLDKEVHYLLLVLESLVHVTADYAYARELIERALSRLAANDARYVDLLSWQASTYIRQGEFMAAAPVAEQAHALAIELGDAKNIAESLYQLGLLAARQGRHESAFALLEESRALRQQIGDRSGEASCLTVLSQVSWRQGQFEQARHFSQQSLAIHQQVDDQLKMAISFSDLGLIADELGEHEAALAYHQQSLAIRQTIGDIQGMAVSLGNLGVVSQSLGKYDLAMDYLQQGLAVFRSIGDRNSEGIVHFNFGMIAYRQGQQSAACDAFEAGLAIFRQLGEQYGVAYCLTMLGFVAMQQGQSAEAEQFFLQALPIAQAISAVSVMLELVVGFSWLCLVQNNPWRAAEWAGMVQQHPALNAAGQAVLADLLALLTAALPAGALAEALQGGADLDLDTVTAELLNVGGGNDLEGEREVETAVSTATLPPLTEEELIEKLLNEVAGDDVEPREKLRGEALLTHLLAVSRRMATMRSVAPLLSYAMNEVISLVGAERGYIVLMNDDGTLDFRVRRRADGSDILSDADTISNSILNEVVRTQQSLVVRNALLDPRFAAAHSVLAMQLRSIMCAPLITQDRIIGAIYVESRSRSGRFTEDDLAPLEFFSNQAAVAIENANLNENLEALVAERTWELAEAKEVAEAANEAKTSFLSNMSHELRTPLNAILNFTGFVYDGLYGEVNGEQQHALQQALDSGEHLLSLINDILDLNKIEAGMMRLVFEEIDMNKIMHHAISTAKGLIKGQPIELIVEVMPDLPVIQADRRRLRQILLNVLSNAAKYTEQGSITIAATHLAEAGYVEIRIEDTGVGIAPKDRHLVFEAYGQARANVSNVVSTGLGMAITHDLVQLHNGRIWFTSEEGVGTTFFLQLPVQQEG